MIAQALNTHKEQGPMLPVNPHLPSAEGAGWETLELRWKPLSSIRRADGVPAGFQGTDSSDSFSAELTYFSLFFSFFVCLLLVGFLLVFFFVVVLVGWFFWLHTSDQEGKKKIKKKWGISYPSRSQYDITLCVQSQFLPRVLARTIYLLAGSLS